MKQYSILTSSFFVLLILFNGCAHRNYIPLSVKLDQRIIPVESYHRVLKSFVTEEGLVEFNNLRENPSDLEYYVGYIAQTTPNLDPGLYGNQDALLAYYINAYNALCMYNVLYSGVLPKNQFRFFFSQKYKINGEFMSLFEFENNVIRKMGDPRIHFALNCMSISCPRLRKIPFEGNLLDAQLNAAAQEFFNDRRHLVLSHETEIVQLSRILKWFKKDFILVSPNITEYANQFLDRKIPESFKVKFFDYDWTLIDADLVNQYGL